VQRGDRHSGDDAGDGCTRECDEHPTPGHSTFPLRAPGACRRSSTHQ
jgi:hypothetical protein